MEYNDKLWIEFFRLIGIANLTEMKKERMIRDEITTSQGGTIASRFSRFEPRSRALREINKLFGDKLEKEIKVEYYDGEPSDIKEDINNEEADINDNLSTTISSDSE